MAGHAQEPVFAKWGYDATTSGRMEPRRQIKPLSRETGTVVEMLPVCFLP